MALPVKVGELISVPSAKKSSVTGWVLKFEQLALVHALTSTGSVSQVNP